MDICKIAGCLLFITASFQPVDGQQKLIEEAKLFAFGAVADVQYADVESAGKRHYRGSLKKLEKCLSIFNDHDLAFVVHLGDLIDRDYNNFVEPLTIFERSKAPVHYVIGNHEFAVADSVKKKVRGLLKNKKGYYDFEFGNVRFVVLDGMDISLYASVEGTKPYHKAKAIYDSLKEAGANNAYPWNGGLGSKQLSWLDKVLSKSDRKEQHVILFSHFPLLPETGLQLWNNHNVLELISDHPSVVASITGHHHAGEYVLYGGVHHLTLKGIVEAEQETTCGIIDVYGDKLIVNGYGDEEDRTLYFAK
tara:strand:- start:1081 stop:1998 length:918 start_codon:yes stop_codon:yes gene_type:complete